MDKKYRYEIDGNNAIRFYDLSNPNENNAPFMFQPDYPNYDPFINRQEAVQWAEDKMAELLDPNAPLAPFGRGHERIVKEPHDPYINEERIFPTEENK